LIFGTRSKSLFETNTFLRIYSIKIIWNFFRRIYEYFFNISVLINGMHLKYKVSHTCVLTFGLRKAGNFQLLKLMKYYKIFILNYIILYWLLYWLVDIVVYMNSILNYFRHIILILTFDAQTEFIAKWFPFGVRCSTSISACHTSCHFLQNQVVIAFHCSCRWVQTQRKSLKLHIRIFIWYFTYSITYLKSIEFIICFIFDFN
jgi:hypothetical protein